MSTSQPQAPALIPLVRPPSFRPKRQTQSETSALRSPFFRPSNPRLSTIKTPSGTKRPAVVINDVPVKDEEKKSSLLGAWANLCNVTIGAGIVGLPYAIKEAGLITGTAMIIMCAIMTDYSLRQVITTGKRANVNSYETLLEATFGRPGFVFLSLNMFFLSYGAMLAYLTIIKDVLPILFGIAPDDDVMKRVVMAISSLVVILPLSMQRDMADLEKTSRLNVFLNLALVGIVTWYSPVVESVDVKGGLTEVIRQEMVWDTKRFFVGFGVASFAFVCQDSSFIIAGSLDNPTKSRWKIVTRAAMSTCCTLELIIGLGGYLAYQEHTLGNVLNNMEIHHWSGLVSRAILATTMFFAYPMNLYIARHACVVLCFEGISAHEGDDHTVLLRNDRRVILTWVLFIASLVPALLNINTGLILSATGAIGGSSLAYIGPGITFIAVYNAEFVGLIRTRWPSSRYLWRYPSVADNRHEQTMPFGVFTWYLLLMPLWSSMAQLGQNKMSEYIEKEELISPGIFKPKRVTVVVPTRTSQMNNDDRNNTIQLQRCPSDSAIETISNDEDSFLIHPKPIKQYGSVASLGTRLSTVELEEEMKKEDPTWTEFYVAMLYVGIGCVAMVLGLISILTK
ncbi:hypothetical protein ACHAWO_011990 [Cyclotella atomus]|uniref:Amino acid transporter transmembrane domain-containing protein n=1 Tax=Cyclotella atomus TaxID=382360 RepID=A0ABD3Q7F3_9STRA